MTAAERRARRAARRWDALITITVLFGAVRAELVHQYRKTRPPKEA